MLDPTIFKRLQSAAKKPTILNVQDCAAILAAYNEQAARIVELEAQFALPSLPSLDVVPSDEQLFRSIRRLEREFLD